jgi:hypothetical protein
VQGLKPSVFVPFAARLKSCPDTKLRIASFAAPFDYAQGRL